jgi:hypothetical protein
MASSKEEREVFPLIQMVMVNHKSRVLSGEENK